ncbi:hypothetical protein ACH5RR_034546 [Cinchona calisaya]|uniref:Bifunctional inhibitor/plant lipid transfer protein/seed storage helical domain-containing protein n=1 Tax=Cinchona calisaya TaxID=153742 RepID=A0ABD2YEU6_9GENT
MGNTAKLWCMCITYVFAATLAAIAYGAAPAPASTVQCTDLISDMIDCIPLISVSQKGSKGAHSNPPATCCSGLKIVLDTNPECICEGIKNSDQMGIIINLTKAAALPALCHLNAPPLSNCNFTTSPVPSPGSGPSPAPPSPSPKPPSPSPKPPSPSPKPPSPSPKPPGPSPKPPGPTPPATKPPSPTPPAANPPSPTPPATKPPTPTNPGSPPPPPTGTPAKSPPTSNSPDAAPSTKSDGTSTMPLFLVSSIMVVTSLLV